MQAGSRLRPLWTSFSFPLGPGQVGTACTSPFLELLTLLMKGGQSLLELKAGTGSNYDLIPTLSG